MPGMDSCRFRPETVFQVLDSLAYFPSIRVTPIGKSIEGRPIHLMKWGNGPVRILLWSQMHGDESTGTMALMDMFQAFVQEKNFSDVRKWKDHLTIYAIPMLNPDGASRYNRRNAVGIDLNRDAERLTTPEGRLLQYYIDSLQPVWAFNLHDQNRYYAAGPGGKPVVMAFLAPAADHTRKMTLVRSEAAALIGQLAKQLKPLIPGQIARYHDAFESRAFGDYATAAGIRTILIEAGWIQGDEQKQMLRQLYFATLMSAIKCIADRKNQPADSEAYFSLPQNHYQFFDLLIRDVRYVYRKDTIRMDIGIRQTEKLAPDGETWITEAEVQDIGDLSAFKGHITMDRGPYHLVHAMAYGHVVPDLNALRQVEILTLIRQGYAIFRVIGVTTSQKYLPLPIALKSPDDNANPAFQMNGNPIFYLANPSGELEYLIVNGWVWDLKNPLWENTISRFISSGIE